MSERKWIVIGVCVVAAVGGGCAPDCTQLKADLQSALQSESPFVAMQSGEDAPMHFGIAVRDSLLNEVVERAMRSGLEKAMSFTDSISLATGQKIALSTEGKVADVGLYPDKACDECLRVDGQLGGFLTVKLPVLGSQRVPLSGSFSVVAPVRFGQTADQKASVILDLSKAAELARSSVRPDVQQLPPTWWKVIKAPLSKRLSDAVIRDLPAVTLFTFRGFDLGIDGLEVMPTKIVSDHKRGVVFAGFTTNLAAGDASLSPRTDLGKNDDVAIGIDRRVLGAMSAALIKSGKVSRTWTKDGEASADGPISVTMPTVSLPDPVGGAQPYTMSFRAWNAPERGKCWWADADATGTIEASDAGELRLAVTGLKVTDSSLPGVFEAIAKWKTSRLFSKSAEVMTKTLTPTAVHFPGSAVTLAKAHLSVVGDGAWLLGGVAVKDRAAADADEDNEDAGE